MNNIVMSKICGEDEKFALAQETARCMYRADKAFLMSSEQIAFLEPTLLSEFEGSGIYAVGFWENGFRELTNNTKEIAAPSDLPGMKIRTMENSVHMATYSALGATPTAMAWSEIFSALQQGTVDGQENPLAIILTAKVYEVQKYISMIDLFYSPCVLMISQDIYEGLTEEQKTAFDQAAEEAKDYQRSYSQDVAQSAREEMEAQGGGLYGCGSECME